MAAPNQVSISLTPELDEFVRARLVAGVNATASDVVLEGLRLLQQRERESNVSLTDLKAKLQRASEQADRGEFVSGDEVFAKLDAIIERRRNESASKAS